MKELIYAGIEVENLVKKQFPRCKIIDASDDIHHERFQLELDVPEKEFYQFAIRNGFAGTCFAFRLRLMDGDSKVKSWIQGVKTERQNMDKKVVIERINEIISKIDIEREKLGNNKFDEGFDCGTQLGLDLFGEWKDQLQDEGKNETP